MQMQYGLFFNAERRNCAAAGVAIMSFRSKYKHDPKTLAELVPEFLNEIPRGYFVPQVVEYVNQKGAWIIYTKSPWEEYEIREIGQLFGSYGVKYDGPKASSNAHFFVPPMK